MSCRINVPAMMYRFMIVFNDFDNITQEVVSSDWDMINKIIKVVIRQPYDLEFSKNFKEFVELFLYKSISNHLRMVLLDGKNTPNITFDFHGCECISHNFELSYSKNDVATHTIHIKYRGFDIS